MTLAVETPLNNPYDLFAAFYAHAFAGENVQKILPFLESVLLRALPENATILDVCCGSGHLARALIERGFRVTGIDNSCRMIEQARSIAPTAEYFVGDVRSFTIERQFDAAVCTFNSLAHFETRQLPAVFAQVHRAIAPSAQFVFDLYLETAYCRRWRGEFEVRAGDECCMVRPTYDPQRRTATSRISMRVAAQDSAPGQTVETTLVQHCHTAAQIEQSLGVAGFEIVSTFDGARDLRLAGEEERAFYITRKPVVLV